MQNIVYLLDFSSIEHVIGISGSKARGERFNYATIVWATLVVLLASVGKPRWHE